MCMLLQQIPCEAQMRATTSRFPCNKWLLFPPTHTRTPEFEPDAQSELLYTGLDSWRKMPISRALHGKGTQNAASNEIWTMFYTAARTKTRTYPPPFPFFFFLFLVCISKRNPPCWWNLEFPKRQYETKKHSFIFILQKERPTMNIHSFFIQPAQRRK